MSLANQAATRCSVVLIVDVVRYLWDMLVGINAVVASFHIHGDDIFGGKTAINLTDVLQESHAAWLSGGFI